MDSQDKSSTMSMTKYFKNFMLCGDLSFYCLLCKETMHDVAYAEKHLRWEKHRKALKSQTCLPQFKSECIYKVERYYYCEFCNFATPNNTEIKSHIESDGHKAFKINPKLITTRVRAKADGDHIIIENIWIDQLQWHSIINKQCLLCNVTITNTTHLYDTDHKIKLVQARINYVDDQYYRKIGDKFQCFACDNVYPIDQFDNHFMNHSNNNTIELKPLNGTVDLRTDSSMNDDTKPVISAEKMDVIYNTREVDIGLLDDVKDEYFDIDKELKQVICKTCKKGLKIIVKEIDKHMCGHNFYGDSKIVNALYDYYKTQYTTMNIDHGKTRSRTAQYGSVNFIKMNAGGSRGYCTICDKFLSASIKVFKGHVSGVFHQGHLELKGMIKPSKREKGSYKPLSVISMIKSLSYSAEKKAFLVNGSLIIDEDSFLLMKRIEHGKHYKKTKCFVCDETIPPADEKNHCLSWQHKSKLLGASCISEEEFVIREVRPKLYHCSACNETMPYWGTLKRHLGTYSHGGKKKIFLTEIERKYSFSKTINLKTDYDNLHLQLINAVFKTKYIIKV